MKSGEFVPNLGIKVRDARHAREIQRQQVARHDTATEPKETEEQRQKRMALAKVRMDEMRKALGMPIDKGPSSEPNET